MGHSAKLFMLATAALLLCSCASHTPNSEKTALFESVAFVTAKDLPELTRPGAEREAVDANVKSGAAAGALGGAAIGAAACGPVLYGGCLAIMSWYGLVVGSVGGAAVGLYNYSGLSYTDSAYVEEVLSGISDRRDFHVDLRTQVERNVPAEALADPQEADAQIVVLINQISFIEVEDELVSTQVQGAMTLSQAQAPDEQPYRESFMARTSAKDIDDLIAGDGQLLESEIDECLSEIADLMGNRLEWLRVEGADKLTR